MSPKEGLLLLREAADQASFKAEVTEAAEARDTTDATVIKAAAHKEMLSWIEVLEALIVELPKQQRPGIGHNQPPVGDEDVQSIKQAIVILKHAPEKASAAGSTLKKIKERLGTYLDNFFMEASKSAGKEVGKRLAQLPYWLAVSYALGKIIDLVTAMT
jgi:hypothetical protein